MTAGINPIPDCNLMWVFGLLETLEDRGGREDGYKIARDLAFKFSDLLKVMKAAEILGWSRRPPATSCWSRSANSSWRWTSTSAS